MAAAALLMGLLSFLAPAVAQNRGGAPPAAAGNTGASAESSTTTAQPGAGPLTAKLPDGLAAGPKHWTSPEGLSSTIQVMLLLTVLSLAPAILLMTTCFVRIVVVLGLLRQAIGTQQLPPSQVITSLALFMTLLVMAPGVEAGLRRGDRALHAAADRPGRRRGRRAWRPIRGFMVMQIERTGNSDDVWLFLELPARPAHARPATTTCRCRPCCRRSCSAN